jgi:hypothetical protein
MIPRPSLNPYISVRQIGKTSVDLSSMNGGLLRIHRLKIECLFHCPCLNIIGILYIACRRYSLQLWSSTFVSFTWIVGAVAASQSIRCQSAKLVPPSPAGGFVPCWARASCRRPKTRVQLRVTPAMPTLSSGTTNLYIFMGGGPMWPRESYLYHGRPKSPIVAR